MLILSSVYFVCKVGSGCNKASFLVASCKTHRNARKHGFCSKVIGGRVKLLN